MPRRPRYAPPPRPVAPSEPAGALGDVPAILTPEDLAGIFQTSRRAILENPDIPRFKVGKAVRYHRRAIEAWMAGQTLGYATALAGFLWDASETRPLTRGALARLLRVWWRDTEGLPLTPNELAEVLYAD